MNTQFKKGVLELIVLKAIVSDDLYGYQLVSRINEVIQVNEGTIYPLLKRVLSEWTDFSDSVNAYLKGVK